MLTRQRRVEQAPCPMPNPPPAMQVPCRKHHFRQASAHLHAQLGPQLQSSATGLPPLVLLEQLHVPGCLLGLLAIAMALPLVDDPAQEQEQQPPQEQAGEEGQQAGEQELQVREQEVQAGRVGMEREQGQRGGEAGRQGEGPSAGAAAQEGSGSGSAGMLPTVTATPAQALLPAAVSAAVGSALGIPEQEVSCSNPAPGHRHGAPPSPWSTPASSSSQQRQLQVEEAGPAPGSTGEQGSGSTGMGSGSTGGGSGGTGAGSEAGSTALASSDSEPPCRLLPNSTCLLMPSRRAGAARYAPAAGPGAEASSAIIDLCFLCPPGAMPLEPATKISGGASQKLRVLVFQGQAVLHDSHATMPVHDPPTTGWFKLPLRLQVVTSGLQAPGLVNCLVGGAA